LGFDWLFRNRHTGGITIAQSPNIALWLLFATVALRRIVAAEPARTAVDWAGVAALAWWATDEVVRGVKPWRRLLGLGGCAAATTGVVSMWH
jgi:hypothetical protein